MARCRTTPPIRAGPATTEPGTCAPALGGVTKRVMVSHSPAQAVQHTQLAIKHALTGQPGPVAVVYHSSALQGRVGPTSLPRIYPTDAYLPAPLRAASTETTLDSAAQTVRAAARPVIVAGNGVRLAHAQDSLVRLAQTGRRPRRHHGEREGRVS